MVIEKNVLNQMIDDYKSHQQISLLEKKYKHSRNSIRKIFKNNGIIIPKKSVPYFRCNKENII